MTGWTQAAKVAAVAVIAAACGGESPYAERALSDAGAPGAVYIVLDTSGSMEEPIGAALKIESAQRAVLNLTSGLGKATDVGIRTYPGSSSVVECSDGQVDLPLGRHSDGAVRSVVEGLYPYGDTPTAEALEATAQDIAGSRGAVGVVLVSDGMSTCADPCSVAERLDRQLDWSVAVVGFDVSGGAAGELQCIADVTGGRYFTVDDGAELEQLFSNPSGLFNVGG